MSTRDGGRWGRDRLGKQGPSMLLVALALGAVRAAAAEEPERSCADIAEQRVLGAQGSPASPPAEPRATPMPRPWTGRFFGAVAVGRGVRFNNPYRLATPWGETPESLSLTATYLDLSLGGAFGKAPGVNHGLVGHLSIATQGVGQQTLTPGYVQLWRLTPRWMVTDRLGVPIVTAPDVNAGMEGALGAMWFATAGMGVTAEVVGSVFYGASTRERDPTRIPILSLQFGVFLDYEVMP